MRGPRKLEAAMLCFQIGRSILPWPQSIARSAAAYFQIGRDRALRGAAPAPPPPGQRQRRHLQCPCAPAAARAPRSRRSAASDKETTARHQRTASPRPESFGEKTVTPWVTLDIWSLFRTRRFNVREHGPTERSHTWQNVRHVNSKSRSETGGQVNLVILL